MNVIEELKNNLAEFDQMSGEMQEAANRIGRGNFCLLLSNGAWDKDGTVFAPAMRYCLRSDYDPNPGPEYIDCEIFINDGKYFFRHYKKLTDWLLLHKAIDIPGFAGFRFPDGSIRVNKIAYSEPGGEMFDVIDSDSDIANFTVIHATAVVFRK